MRRTTSLIITLLCTVISVAWAQSPVSVSTEQQLREAIQDSAVINLQADISTVEPLTISTAVTINLGNHALSHKVTLGKENDCNCIFIVSTGADLTLNNGTIDDVTNMPLNNADNAGAIVNKGKLTLNSVTISNCKGYQGGAIKNLSGAELNINSSNLEGNVATNDDNNDEYGNGGAIWNAGTLNISGSNIKSGKAINGGAIYNCETGVINTDMTNKFSSNNVTGNGGAIWNKGELNLSAVTFSTNKADDKAGAVWNIGSLTISNCTFTGNSAYDGSALYNAPYSSSQVNITGGTFTSNNGKGYGAVMNAVNASEMKIQGTTFTDNVASNGAAIYCESKMDLNQVTLQGNQASSDGGGILTAAGSYVTINNSTSIESNTASGKGGGICSNGTLILDDVAFTGNTGSNGGGLYANGTLTTINLGCSFKTNTSKYDGAAVYCNSGSTTFDNILIQSNTANRNGAGLFIAADADVTLNNESVISDNVSANNGSAISNLGELTVNGGSIKNNTCTEDEFHGDSGGAISNDDDGIITLDGVTLSGNKNNKTDGGAIINSKAKAIIKNCTITGNTVPTNGAGLWNYGVDAQMTVTDCTISNNTAGSNGGAIYNMASQLTINGDTKLIGNKAGKEGGAIWNRGGTVTMNKGSITENTCNGDGGAIFNKDHYSYNSVVKLTGTVISDNISDGNGSAISNMGTLIFNGGSVTNNTCTEEVGGGDTGGAIYNDWGTLTLEGITISGNKNNRSDGGAIINNKGKTDLKNCIITGNSVPTHGAGIWNYGTDAEMTIKDCTISNNSADKKGGAIFNGYGLMTISGDTKIIGNTAGTDGGAIWNRNGTLTINGGTITGNTCIGKGGGIYNEDYLGKKGVVNLLGTTVTDNIAGTSGGGVYNNGTLSVNDDTKIEDNKKLNTDVSNILLGENKIITITSRLSEGHQFTVSREGDANGTLTSGYGQYNTAPPMKHFISEDDDYIIVLSGDEARLQSKLGNSVPSIQGASDIDLEEGVWYDLIGRKLYEKPTQQGTYIKDGIKVVIF